MQMRAQVLQGRWRCRLQAAFWTREWRQLRARAPILLFVADTTRARASALCARAAGRPTTTTTATTRDRRLARRPTRRYGRRARAHAFTSRSSIRNRRPLRNVRTQKWRGADARALARQNCGVVAAAKRERRLSPLRCERVRTSAA